MPNRARKITNQSSKDTSRSGSNQNTAGAARGFASMPDDQVEEIARKGGQASADQAGHEGMAERGHKGGSAPHESRGRPSSHNDEGDEGRQHTSKAAGAASHEVGSRQGSHTAKGDEGPHAKKAAGSQGFASQPKEKVQEAARKGGEHSRK